MSIKKQIKAEIELRSKLRGQDKLTIRSIAKAARIDYNGLSLWLKDDTRSMGDRNIEKVLDVLNKKVVLIDKDV